MELHAKKKIYLKLKKLAKDGMVTLHTRQIHRELIPNGSGSCSADRYIRQLRAEGLIDYPDPRLYNNFYLITIL